MSSPRDVVITGLGIVSPIGIGRAAFEQALLRGESGVRPITQYDATAMSVRFGGELKDFEPKLYVTPRKSIKVMSHEIQMAVASANLAMEDAQLDKAALDPARFGVVYGAPMLYAEVPELEDLIRGCTVNGRFDFDRFGEQFPKQMIPLWMLKYLPNMAASHIGIAHNACGPNNSIVQNDVSSLVALIEAATVIQRGAADVMLAGGTGNRLALTGVAYRGDENLSKRNDEPTRASRPFDADRDGMVIGEGSGTLVLESLAHAQARGATSYGTIEGYACTHRGASIRPGMQRAIERSIRTCLATTGIPAGSVDHVNAHGLSDRDHDRIEASAIRAVLGDVPVTAIKSYFGNVGAASGALELAASLLGALRNGIPSTLNYEHPDAACPVNVVGRAGAPSRGTAILKLNQAGTGQAVALLVRRPR